MNRKLNSISLLPKSIKSSNNNRSYVDRLLIIIAIILILALFTLYIVLFIHTRKINHKLRLLKEQRKAIEIFLEDKKDILTAKDEINRLQGIVEKAIGKVPDWSALFIDIDKCKTDDIHNRNVKGSFDDTEAVIIINGNTNSQQSIKTYMDRISELATVSDVELRYIRQIDMEDTTQLEFEIIIYIIQEN